MIKSILLKQDLFPKAKIFVSSGEGSLPNKFIVGPNMIFVENADWKRHRKLANPAFQQAMPHKVFGKLTIQMFDIIDESLKKNTSLDIGDVLKRLTLDALTLAGFGFDIHALQDPNNEWLRTYQSIITGMQDPLFFFFPIFETRFLHVFPKRQVIHDDCDRFLKLMDDMIKEKRETINKSIEDTVTSKVDTEDSQEKDILTLLLEGEESEGAYMTNDELKSNLCAFFSAGHDSTTGALSFALYHMAVNQDIQQKARDEVQGILGDSNKDIIPTIAQTKAMDYLNMIIKETLRIQPSVPVASARKAKEDCKLGERFRPGGEADQKISGEFGNSWIPFSNGARQCIGMNFSLAEQRVVLSMLLRKYTWSLPKGSIHDTNVITKGIFFIVAKDLELSFTPRY
ncbi:cytochrome P450 [Helicostylum pulchrum]|nr:cytochrome P450 [Helicostylum pulchrum]